MLEALEVAMGNTDVVEWALVLVSIERLESVARVHDPQRLARIPPHEPRLTIHHHHADERTPVTRDGFGGLNVSGTLTARSRP